MGEAFIRKKSRVPRENEIFVVKDGQFQPGFDHSEGSDTSIGHNDGYISLIDNTGSPYVISISFRPSSHIYDKIFNRIRVTAKASSAGFFYIMAYGPGYEVIADYSDGDGIGTSWVSIDVAVNENTGLPLREFEIYSRVYSLNIKDISLFAEEAL